MFLSSDNTLFTLTSTAQQATASAASPKKKSTKRAANGEVANVVSGAKSDDRSTNGDGPSGGLSRKEARVQHYCHICNKGFKDRYSVNVHVRTHTGEKPFSCPLCGKCFRQKAHLAKHHQTHVAKQAQPTTTASSSTSSSVSTAPTQATIVSPPPTMPPVPKMSGGSMVKAVTAVTPGGAVALLTTEPTAIIGKSEVANIVTKTIGTAT